MAALWPLQVAVVARLKAATALMAIVTGVYDGAAPEGSAMPYVVVDGPTEEPFDALGTAGYELTLLLHVWSGDKGSSKQVNDIAALVDAALASAALTPTAHTSATVRKDFRQVLVEDDGTRHMPIRYRFFVWST